METRLKGIFVLNDVFACACQIQCKYIEPLLRYYYSFSKWQPSAFLNFKSNSTFHLLMGFRVAQSTNLDFQKFKFSRVARVQSRPGRHPAKFQCASLNRCGEMTFTFSTEVISHLDFVVCLAGTIHEQYGMQIWLESAMYVWRHASFNVLRVWLKIHACFGGVSGIKLGKAETFGSFFPLDWWQNFKFSL